MSRKINLILFLIILPWIICAQTPVARGTLVRKKFVLILSSYTYGDKWNTAIAKSLCTKIENENPEISITVGYAGIGRRNSFLSEQFAMEGAFSNGRLSAEIETPDVLVLIGDEGWMIYRTMDMPEAWKNVPVVLSGVSEKIMKDYRRFFPERHLKDSPMISLQESIGKLPVTGVVLRDNTRETLSMMKQLNPQLDEVVFLSNNCYQDAWAANRLARAVKHEPGVTLRTLFVNAANTDSIGKVITRLPSTAAVIVNKIPVPKQASVPVFMLLESTSTNACFTGSYTSSTEDIARRTTQLILLLYRGESAYSIPLVYMNGHPLLNKESVNRFGWKDRAESLPGVVFYNIPPPFFVRHIRPIALLVSFVIVCIFSTLILARLRSNSRRLEASLDTFKQLYDKYQMVYKNIPLGLLSLDEDGDVLQRNEGSELFLNFFPMYSNGGFNLFRSGILDKEAERNVRKGVPVSVMRWMENVCFRFIFRPIRNEKTGEQNILMIVAENTEIEQARIEKENYHKMLNFAMNASALGVAEYNLVDRKGFATQAWYINMGIEQGKSDLSISGSCLLPEYQARIDDCLELIGQGVVHPFLEVVEVQYPSGERHWLRYFVQLMEYAPQDNRIVVAELTYNIDEQVRRENELSVSLKKAREADRLKNAFIANMREDIRIPLYEIVRTATLLTEEKDPEEMIRLNECLEYNNQVLLNLINQLIDISTKNDE